MKHLLYLTTILLVLTSCSDKSTDSKEVIQEETDTLQPEEYLTLVENLRVRESPNLNSRVLLSLKEGTKILYLHEKSSHTDKITLRGKEYDTHWLKIKLTSDTISGWVYGGAVEAISKIRSNKELAKSEQKINNATGSEMSKLFQIPIINSKSKKYNGRYSYYLTLDGQKVLDGKFEIESKELIEEYNTEAVIKYTGRFINGAKDGAFVRTAEYPESSAVTTLYFEVDSDKCKWGSYIGNSEGMDYNYREENPEQCDFDYIANKAE